MVVPGSQAVKAQAEREGLDKVFAALREDGMSRKNIAEAIFVYQDDLDALTFGLSMTALDGGGEDAPERPERPNLRIVGS